MSDENLQICLASRPKGAPSVDDFDVRRGPKPSPGEGELLLRTRYLSLDPYMRGRMSDAPSYAEPVPVGGVMVGGTVSVVEESRHPDFQAGDHVLAMSGWQTYAVSNGEGLRKLELPEDRLSLALGALGMPGFTAWWGLNRIGEPKQGETLVVAAATGPVASKSSTIRETSRRMSVPPAVDQVAAVEMFKVTDDLSRVVVAKPPEPVGAFTDRQLLHGSLFLF